MAQQGEVLGGGLPGGGEAQASREREGLGKFLHDLRHRRRRFRQLVGVAFVVWMTLAGSPEANLWWLGTVLASLGMLVRLWASGFVMKNEVLATVGPYARVRHPLYVGNFLICMGFCAASGLWWSVPVAAAMWLAFYPQTIRYEDQKLRRLFPGDWDRWAAETRALLPRLTPYRGNGVETRLSDRVPWSLARSLLRNGEPLHILLLGAGLWYLRSKL
jgi:protein-S-isoprenylcysteine O-methyltransferase Ste14